MSFAEYTKSTDPPLSRAADKPRPVYVVDGQPIHVSTIAETCRGIIEKVKDRRSFYICTLNLDHLVKLRADALFRKVYAEAEIVTADGFPIVMLAAFDRVRLERVTGSDLVVPICEAAALNDLSVYFVAPSTKTRDLCVAALGKMVPNLRIAGTSVPPPNFDPRSDEATELIQRIGKSNADICFVALGAPKQEFLSALACAQLRGTAFIPVGAALDFVAGTKRRAPAWLRALGLEWSWRLATEPHRLFRRYLHSAFLFARLIFKRVLP